MVVINAVGVSEGFAEGTLICRKISNHKNIPIRRENFESELQRYAQAKSKAQIKLKEMYESMLELCGKSEAELFIAYQMMLEDDDYQNGILELIESKHMSAENAINISSKKFIDMFLQMDSEYMKARAEDVESVSRLLIDCLNDTGHEKYENILPGSIVFAENLNPGEIPDMKKIGVAGIITSGGSETSHSSIIAKVMGIPTIVGAGDRIKEEFFGKFILMDGTTGKIYVEPNDALRSKIANQSKNLADNSIDLEVFRGKASITSDGKKIEIYANMNSPSEIDEILKSDAEGIGLFRTEFLYLGRNSYPSEEEQFEVYKGIAQKMAGKKVIIRTLDIGSDKQEQYMNFPREENPALGYRGIRVCLDLPEIFRAQLRAIYRASAFGDFSVMFPMISYINEIRNAKKIAQEVRDELVSAGISVGDDIPIGMMIETPAAAIMSDAFAKEVDFFSIGTNDLTQYVFALDRQSALATCEHENSNNAVLRLIELISKNARSCGISVGICGEMANDVTLVQRLLNAGVNEFSVLPKSVLNIRKEISLSKAMPL